MEPFINDLPGRPLFKEFEMTLNRRTCLFAAATAGLGALSPWAMAAPNAGNTANPLSPQRPAAPILRELRIYIPAGAGGGWDQTGRNLGAAMQSAGLVTSVTYENKGGKGGTIGLADFVERYRSDPNALFVGGLVMVGALALARSEAIKQLTPIARLTSDYMVLCTPINDKIPNFKALVAKLEKDVTSVTFCGGSAGGVDHMLAAMLVRSLRLDTGKLQYMPTSSGKEAISLLQSGKADVAISGYSEFKGSIETKAINPLAVSSRRALFGIQSLRDQGVNTELANWRAVFTSSGITEAQKATLRKLVVATTETSGWKHALLENNWVGSPLHGRELDSFIQFEEGIATVITQLLKLKT
jgi:putative tricarboxylic transport membrane protein